jgi:hypothetical protein
VALFIILAIQLGRCPRYNHRVKSLRVISATIKCHRENSHAVISSVVPIIASARLDGFDELRCLLGRGRLRERKGLFFSDQ